MELVSNQFDGARKYSCKEARQMLEEDKTVKVLWRPDRMLSINNPDEDIAFVWLKD
jgi:hypothetical protein